jgi:hypothetical protein
VSKFPEPDEQFIETLPAEYRDFLKNIRFDIRIDLNSITSEPYVTTVMDQVALAGMKPDAAADAIIKITREASHSAYDSVNHDEQASLIQWVLKGYFPNSPTPIKLMTALKSRLKPKKVAKKSG